LKCVRCFRRSLAMNAGVKIKLSRNATSYVRAIRFRRMSYMRHVVFTERIKYA
jgi:hypothetical protein